MFNQLPAPPIWRRSRRHTVHHDRLRRRLLTVFSGLLIAVLTIMPALAQDAVNQGVLSVSTGETLYFGGNFTNNSTGAFTNAGSVIVSSSATFQNGVIDEPNSGVVIFQDNATAANAADSSHVDGLVRKIGNDAFTFPTGDGGQYGPVSISAPGAVSDQVDARYWLSNPQTDAGPTLGAGLAAVSSVEYWNVSGAPSVNLTLHWNSSSGIGTLSSGNLANLRVAGWDGSQWVDLGNDATTGDATAGAITANSITPNSYQAYTIGSAAAASSATIDKTFSTDGTTFTDDVTVAQYRTVTERLYFNNTGASAATGVTISTTVPAGFEVVPNSTKVCLEPTPGEVVCNTDAGMGGPIIDAAVWNGQTLSIAPTAGLYGEPVSATSGRLEVGKKRYFNMHECQYFYSPSGDRWFDYKGNETGTNVSNTPDTTATCVNPWGSHVNQSKGVTNFDLLGRRYLNLHECQYIFNGDRIWLLRGVTGSNTSNSPSAAATCASNWGSHSFVSKFVDALDLQDNRYLNWQDCHYVHSSGDRFNSSVGNADTHVSNTPDTTATCVNPWGTHTNPWRVATAFDLLDTTRGTGYVEFQLRAKAEPNVYAQTVEIDGNEFSQQQDSGTITVTPPPPVTVDKTFSTDGVHFTDDIIVLESTTLTERLYYNNTDILPATGATISTIIPAGFSLVPNSTKVCLEPTPGEVVCNTDPGMGGSIDENAVWNGQMLNIAPTAGLYGESVSATSGRIEVGRKRYFNMHECQYMFTWFGGGDRWFNYKSTQTGTNVSNTRDTVVSCANPWGSHWVQSTYMTNFDLLGRRYLNLHECQYIYGADRIWLLSKYGYAGSNTSNIPDAAPSCASKWVSHLFRSSFIAALDLQDNRYLNFHDCHYFHTPTGDRFNSNVGNAGTSISNTPDTNATCVNPWGSHTQPWRVATAFDLLDTSRGTGYIEFQVVANAAVGTYPQDVTSSSNEFSDYTDTGTITVRTLVDDDGDGIPNWVEGDGFVDTDGDTIPDSQDADSDNDGIPDAVERGSNPNSPRDTDRDGIPNYRDLDSDNDGLNDVDEAGGLTDDDNDGMADGADGNGDGMIDSPQNSPVDTDGDSVPNYLDLDSDNDTVSDLLEGGSGAADANNDGVADGPDSDGDGIVDDADDLSGFGDAAGTVLPDKDSGSDNDAAPDYLDADDDANGGALDIDAAGNGNLDTNSDGVLDASDTGGGTDADSDGIDDLVDEDPALFGGLNNDTDGDGIPNTLDADDDNDGIPDAVEIANAPANGDTDGDGIPDHLDLDSDNDGINDVIEAGGADAKGDGQIDNPATAQGTLTTPTDSDGDGQPNYVDLDSDNDTVSDLVESSPTGLLSGSDADNDGMVDGPDSDGDGIQDSVDGLSGFGDANDPALPDKDAGSDDDGAPDYADPDDDANGINDIDITANTSLDTNGDGMVDGSDTGGGNDVDNDGIDDLVDQDTGNFGGLPAPTIIDSDNDGIPDAIDPDDDNDGILDVNEPGDTDGDGIPDSLESNTLDTDGDGNPDFNDSNADDEGGDDGTGGEEDGVLTGPWNDGDNDGIPDHLDAANGDGSGPTIAGSGDSDSDGIPDGVECPNGYICDDTDGDGIPNYMDTDSDNDGTNDGQPGEGATDDADNDGIPDFLDPAVGDGSGDTIAGRGDSDGDGIDDKAECPNGYPCPDTDGNGLMDYMDAGSVAAPVKLFLQGAYDELGNALRDDLRTLGDFPLTSPYGGGETTGAGVLAVSGSDAIVDWVLVELRDSGSNTTVVASAAGLLQKDGDVVSASDGTSVLSFSGVSNGNYYVAVHHRNHLAAMTGSPVAVSSSTALVNFTTMNDAATFGSNAQVELAAGVYGLWAGNVNGNTTVIRSSTGNDLDPLLNTVLDDPGNSAKNTNYVVNGYLPGDVNMDGQVIASGGNNDVNLVLNNVLDHPGNSGNANYIINEQLPVDN